MILFYNIAILLYASGARFVSFFNKKARKMLLGQKETFNKLRAEIDPNAEYIWFHAASLGEFEQGRPIIELIKKEHPHYKILLTFFSPSGYEIRKEYALADIVCYLPFDKPTRAKRFVKIVQPKIAIFIKYEFWYNYINQLHKNKIPTYLVSAIFRPEQVFFKWYGGIMRNLLKKYNCICLQDSDSAKLLSNIGIQNTVVCGDTRFDRVMDIKAQAKNIPIVERFARQAKDENEIILIAGSSWPKDEDIIVSYFNRNTDLKLIIAPHEIDEAHLKYLEGVLQRPHIRYTQAIPQNVNDYDCIIIDCFGLLSSIYHYGQIAYVGGGFGVGIHNVLEAAVYNIPVIFGPNFKKFREAEQLVEQGGGYPIAHADDFRGLMDEFTQYPDSLSIAGDHAGNYVKNNTGAVQRVLDILNL